MDALWEKLQTVLGDAYQIDRELPGGSMSRLFVATERALDRAVVVKVLPPELTSELSATRFQREMLVTAHLQHPHILPVLAAGSRAGLLYYVSPYVAGESLRARLRRDGALPLTDALRTLGEVANALAFAHAHGVVHRDVKPENIFLAGEHALLADFGIARAVDAGRAADRLTASGMSVGTPGYMAPEQIAGDADVDARADVYALAVVGYEMLAGVPPYAGTTIRDLIAAQMATTPPPLPARRPDTPPQVSTAITRALSSDPMLRPATAEEFGRMLQAGASAADGPRGTWQTRRSLGLVAAMVVVTLAAFAFWHRSHRASAVAPTPMVAVFPFDLTGRSEDQYLGPGMVELLGTTLDGAGDLHTVSPRAVLAAATPHGGASQALDPAAAKRIADALGANLYVLGTVVNFGGRLRVTAALYDVHATEPAVSALADGDTSDVFGLVDRLSAQLLAGRAHGPSGRITRLASVTTQSLPALKAYLEGESAFRANRFEAARDALERAVAADTGFALAYYRLSLVGEWLLRIDLAEQAATRAARFSERLPPRDHQLVAALLANRRGDIPEAERIYRSLLGTYPDDIEAWWQLGEILFHNGPVMGRALTDAYPPFARVLALDPISTPALVHLARIAAATGHRPETDSLVARAIALAPAGERAYELRALRVAVDGDPAGFRTLIGELKGAEDFQTWLPAFSLAVYPHRIEEARAILMDLTDSSRARDVRARGYTSLAALDVMQGHLRQAEDKLDRAEAVAPGFGLEYRALIDLLPFRPLDRDRLTRARRALAQWDAARMPNVAIPNAVFSANNGIHTLIRGYLLGLHDAALGDARAAERDAADLASARGAVQQAPLTHDYQASVAAEILWRSGHEADALAALPLPGQGYYEWYLGSPFRSEGRERYRRAQALALAHQDTAALRWFGSFEAASLDDLMYLAPSYLDRGRIEERRGHRAQAADDYREVLQLWPEPDPELRSLVIEARQRLAALGS